MVGMALREYRFEYPQPIRRGRTVFSVHNEGRLNHLLVLLILPPDLPGTLDSQLHSPNRRPTAVQRVLPLFHPGDSTLFALELTPGRYGFICSVKDPDGIVHDLKGMNSEFRVR